MSVIINPGSGPVENATVENARASIRVFAEEIGAQVKKGDLGHDQEDGRWSFELEANERTVEVEVPGLPVELIRYVGGEDQNIWDFPRLYVDGSSWVWCYAIRSATQALFGEEEE